jgi:uncharacterized membrane protein YczE
MMPLVRLASTSTTPVARRLGRLLGALVLVALGIACTIRAELGVAPYDVLTTGLAERTGLPIGLAAIVLPVVFVGLGMALGGTVGPGTVICTLVVGPMLQGVLAVLPEVEAMAPRVALFSGGLLVVAAGITGVIVAGIGNGPAELVMIAVHEKGYELARTRTAIELVCVAIGWILGGQIGVGTAVVAVTIGPLLRTFLRWSGYRPEEAGETALRAEPGA